MKKIGITGQEGFVGSHLYNTLGLYPDKFQRLRFDRHLFDDPDALDEFVRECDVVVHLAGMNRHDDPGVIYRTNVDLCKKLVASLTRCNNKAHVIFSSSVQEEDANLYGTSKRKSRELFSEWRAMSDGAFTGMLIPNVFGPFGKPYYNSVVATFCYELTHGLQPKVSVDKDLGLIYVDELVTAIVKAIDDRLDDQRVVLQARDRITVSSLLELLTGFRDTYINEGRIPAVGTPLLLNLFNTLRSYIDLKAIYPIAVRQFVDQRGVFGELIRLDMGGQASFSTTLPGAVRGNHFHTRKIERFTVIKGDAVIQLRRVGTTDILEFGLSGETPSYVDIPIWYTHNIKNVGSTDMYTFFWISECYDPIDPDTYFETV